MVGVVTRLGPLRVLGLGDEVEVYDVCYGVGSDFGKACDCERGLPLRAKYTEHP